MSHLTQAERTRCAEARLQLARADYEQAIAARPAVALAAMRALRRAWQPYRPEAVGDVLHDLGELGLVDPSAGYSALRAIGDLVDGNIARSADDRRDYPWRLARTALYLRRLAPLQLKPAQGSKFAVRPPWRRRA